jgi:hypothetical protein
MAKARAMTSQDMQTARVEIQRAVDRVAELAADIQVALRRAERKIETDARKRVRALRRDAKAQLAQVKDRRREAIRMLKRVSAAAGGSWRDVKKATDRTVTEARTVAESVIGRFRRAVRA